MFPNSEPASQRASQPAKPAFPVRPPPNKQEEDTTFPPEKQQQKRRGFWLALKSLLGGFGVSFVSLSKNGEDTGEFSPFQTDICPSMEELPSSFEEVRALGIQLKWNQPPNFSSE